MENVPDDLADRQFTPLGTEASQEVAPPKPPELSNAQMLSGAIDAGRNVFCFVCKIESPKHTLDADRLGELWGPVFDKYGWDLKKYMGEYAPEIAAVLGSLTMVIGMYKAAVAELDAKPKDASKDGLRTLIFLIPMRAPKALTIAAFGARGAGKTVWVKQKIAELRPARLIVWDYKHDADLSSMGKPFKNWKNFALSCKAPAFQSRYLVSPEHDPHEQFEAFCALAWREGNVLMFVDELPEVTKANKAPPTWRKCVNVGWYYDGGTKALSIIGAGQRAAEVDKSFLSNCDIIHTGRLGYADAKLFARMWGIKEDELTGLADLHWVEKRADQRDVDRGVLSFSQKKTVKK